MNIRETIKAVQDLGKTVPHDSYDTLDDVHEVAYLLATCEPALSEAACQHLMGQFWRLRDAAEEKAAS